MPVLITGSLSSPKFRPDLEALVKGALDIDKKKLEDEAKEALGSKAEGIKDLLGQGRTTDDKAGEEKGAGKAEGLFKGLLKNN